MRLPVLALLVLINCQNFGNYWDTPDNSGKNKPPVAPVKKRMFLHTSPTVGGNLGGIAGADATCNASAQRPDITVTYAALIADGTARRACVNPNCTDPGENIGWVLKPNAIYLQAAGTVQIATTNSAGIFTFPLSAAPSASAGFYLSGLNPDWTTGQICVGAGGNWSGTMSATNCHGGQAGAFDATSIQNGIVGCTSATNYLLCVEQ